MSIVTLTSLNALNCYLFWYMWRGFYWSEGLSGAFVQMLIFQLLVTVASFGFYFVRDKEIALKLAPSGIAEGNREAAGKLASLAGAYGLSLVNLVVAGALLAANGTIDIWASGNAI